MVHCIGMPPEPWSIIMPPIPSMLPSWLICIAIRELSTRVKSGFLADIPENALGAGGTKGEAACVWLPVEYTMGIDEPEVTVG